MLITTFRDGAEVEVPRPEPGRPAPEVTLPGGQLAVVSVQKVGSEAEGRAILREQELLARVRTELVRRPLGGAVAGARLWLLAEPPRGVPLRAVLRLVPVTWDQAAVLGEELLVALAALHESGPVHGDLSDDSIILGDDGRIVLAGAGLAPIAPGAKSSQAGDLGRAGQVLDGIMARTSPSSRKAVPERVQRALGQIATDLSGGGSGADSAAAALALWRRATRAQLDKDAKAWVARQLQALAARLASPARPTSVRVAEADSVSRPDRPPAAVAKADQPPLAVPIPTPTPAPARRPQAAAQPIPRVPRPESTAPTPRPGVPGAAAGASRPAQPVGSASIPSPEPAPAVVPRPTPPAAPMPWLDPHPGAGGRAAVRLPAPGTRRRLRPAWMGGAVLVALLLVFSGVLVAVQSGAGSSHHPAPARTGGNRAGRSPAPATVPSPGSGALVPMPVLAPSSNAPIQQVLLSQQCPSGGGGCVYTVTANLGPHQPVTVNWELEEVDRCDGAVTEVGSGQIPAPGYYTYVEGQADLSISSQTPVGLVAVAGAPGQAASTPLLVTPPAASCPS